MLCRECLGDKEERDFIGKEATMCYRCLYKNKVLVAKKKNKCRECGKKFLYERKGSGNQRYIYCSIECADIGHKKQVNQSWTRQLRAQLPLVRQDLQFWSLPK